MGPACCPSWPELPNYRQEGQGGRVVRKDGQRDCLFCPSIMLHAPATFHTYSLRGVTLQMRRTDRAARAAYIAEALRQHAQIYGARVVIPPHCIACGQLGAGDWCNTCEMHGTCPYLAHPTWITSMCLRCVEDDAACPECHTAPSEGPQELHSFHSWESLLLNMDEDEVQVQVAGQM